MREWGN